MSYDLGKLALLAPAGTVLFCLVLWRPLVGFWLLGGSVSLDYLLAVAGYSTLGALSVGRLSILCLLGAAIVRRFARPVRVPPAVGWLFFWTAVWAVVFCCSAVLAFQPSLTYNLVITGVFTATLPFIMHTLVRTPVQLRRLLWAIALGISLSGLIGVLHFTGALPSVSLEEAADLGDVRGKALAISGRGGEDALQRFSGPMRNPNGFAITLLGAMPLLCFFLISRISLWQRLTAGVALAACGFSLMLTASRTGILAFALFLAVAAALVVRATGRRRWVILGAGGLLAVAFVGAVMMTGGLLQRLGNALPGSEDNSVSARYSVFLGGVHAVLAHPLLGLGPNNTRVANFNGWGLPAHDAMAGVAGELGLLGVAAMLGMVWQTFALLIHTVKQRAPEEIALTNLGRLLQAWLILILIQGFGNNIYGDRAFWLVLGLAAVYYQVRLDSSRAAAGAKRLPLRRAPSRSDLRVGSSHATARPRPSVGAGVALRPPGG